jgi:hypothetical protein
MFDAGWWVGFWQHWRSRFINPIFGYFGTCCVRSAAVFPTDSAGECTKNGFVLDFMARFRRRNAANVNAAQEGLRSVLVSGQSIGAHYAICRQVCFSRRFA